MDGWMFGLMDWCGRGEWLELWRGGLTHSAAAIIYCIVCQCQMMPICGQRISSTALIHTNAYYKRKISVSITQTPSPGVLFARWPLHKFPIASGFASLPIQNNGENRIWSANQTASFSSTFRKRNLPFCFLLSSQKKIESDSSSSLLCLVALWHCVLLSIIHAFIFCLFPLPTFVALQFYCC